MKSYTDLEQSKKLADFLPLESADMYYIHDIPYAIPYENRIGAAKPCWSLASLLGVLPLEIDTHKQTDEYKIYYYVELYMKRMGKEIYLSTERHENLVDACYELILKLHELKTL